MKNIDLVYNMNGNVLIGLLIFLPLLLSGLASLSISALYLKEKTKILSFCRQHVLQIQNQMSESLNELQKLNPLARSLRLERKEIEYLLPISPPGVQEALLVRLSYVTARQIKLNLIQKALIKKAEVYATQHLRRLKQRIHSFKHAFILSSQVPLSAKLAVIARPLTSLSPSYTVSWNFTKEQSVKIKWIENPVHIIPAFLKVFFSKIPSINGQCETTLRRSSTLQIKKASHFIINRFVEKTSKEKKWRPVLL